MLNAIRLLGGFWSHRLLNSSAPRRRNALEAWQDSQVRSLLKKVLPRSTYYRELFGGRDLKDWRQFPVSDHRMLMKHFDQWNTVGLVRELAFERALEAEASGQPLLMDGHRLRLSRGRSGMRSLFVLSQREHRKHLVALLGRARHFSALAENRIAYFVNPAYGIIEGLRPLVDVRFFDSTTPLEETLRSLTAWKPNILVAAPSVLRALAVAHDEGRLELTAPAVVSTEDVLNDEDRTFIESRLQCRIEEYYAAAEGFLGLSCPAGRLHLNEDLFVIQREAVPGQPEQFVPIITALGRTSLPLIRYRLDDVLTETRHPCPCGLRSISIERVRSAHVVQRGTNADARSSEKDSIQSPPHSSREEHEA